MERNDEDFETGAFLKGVRVLEIGDEHVEYCGKVLAGLGADVLKVEPLGGERTRQYGPFVAGRTDVDSSLHFWHFNFGKKSAVVDLDTDAGRERLAALLAVADVVIDGRPRGYLEERGFSYERLRELNESVIYLRVSPFGDDGPWRDFSGSDLVHLALGGVMMNCGYDPAPGGDYDTPPIAPQMWQAYQITGEIAAYQTIVALLYRRRTGTGQQLSASVHEAVSMNTEADFPDWVFRGVRHDRVTCRHSYASDGVGGASTTLGASVTKDGRWLKPYQTYLPGAASSTDALVRLMAPYGMQGDLDDPSYSDPTFTASPHVTRHVNDVIDRFIRAFKFEKDIWIEAQRLGLPWAPIRKPEENLVDEHWRRREAFIEIEEQSLARGVSHVRAKWFAPGLPWRAGPTAPTLGQHSDLSPEDWAPRVDGSRAARGASEDVKLSAHGQPFALAGVRVLDLGWIIASGGAGRFLAAHGAEVIKVEHASKIDLLRNAGAAPVRDAEGNELPADHDVPTINRSGAFMDVNAGKLALSLNLKDPRGREILVDLIRQADVLIEGFSAGTMKRLGLGYDVLEQLNPRLVYVQQSGMGQSGTYGRLKAFGPTAQAMSGITEMSGLPDPYPPAGIGYSYLDWFGAYQVALAAAAGLHRREQTGSGCWIDSSQVEAGMYLTGATVLDYSVNGRQWERIGNRSTARRAAPHGAYRAAGQDRWIAISAFTEDDWQAIVRVLGRPEWASEPRFATLDERIRHQDELDAEIAVAISSWDASELMNALQEHGVAAGICQTAQDRVENDPQLRHLGWMTDLVQTDIGRWPVKNAPVRFSETPPYIGGILDRHGPNYGEDNEYVLQHILGLSAAQQSDLEAAGVL